MANRERTGMIGRVIGVVIGIGLAAGLATAAEQTILGKVLVVKDSSGGLDPLKRSVKSTATEKASPNTLVGNPTLSGSAGGAILEVFLDGNDSSTQAFTLPQGVSSTGKPFWSASSTGYKYSDPKSDVGPVKGVAIQRSSGGTFTIKLKVLAKGGPVLLVPPNNGTSGCVAVKLGVGQSAVGDRYSVLFSSGVIKNNGAKLFQVKKPTTQGTCPVSTTTTTTTSTSSTTTTTLYGSPSRAFLSAVHGLLD